MPRSERRQETIQLTGHLDEILAALGWLRSHPDADANRVGVMGFSRGGLLTLQAAIQQPQAVHAVILMAPAHGRGAMTGLVKTIKKYDLNHIITFHNRIQQATDFSNDLSSLLEVLPSGQGLRQQHWSRYISGKMPTGDRTALLDGFRNLPDDQVGILSNARCLNEGVDVPAIDGIAFIEPRRSKTDIVQAVGRAIRWNKEGKVGTITIPVFVGEGEDAETALSSSRFEPVWGVLQALRDHDEILSQELDALRYELGRRGSIGGQLPGKLVIEMPVSVGDEFVRALETRIVEATTASWEFWFGLLVAYKEARGDTNVPAIDETEAGFRLGSWVGNQREFYKQGTLSADRIARLDAIGFVWVGTSGPRRHR
jgi:pimeloyl-ACP methyl ester carboxylesterase